VSILRERPELDDDVLSRQSDKMGDILGTFSTGQNTPMTSQEQGTLFQGLMTLIAQQSARLEELSQLTATTTTTLVLPKMNFNTIWEYHVLTLKRGPGFDDWLR